MLNTSADHLVRWPAEGSYLFVFREPGLLQTRPDLGAGGSGVIMAVCSFHDRCIAPQIGLHIGEGFES